MNILQISDWYTILCHSKATFLLLDLNTYISDIILNIICLNHQKILSITNICFKNILPTLLNVWPLNFIKVGYCKLFNNTKIVINQFGISQRKFVFCRWYYFNKLIAILRYIFQSIIMEVWLHFMKHYNIRILMLKKLTFTALFI